MRVEEIIQWAEYAEKQGYGYIFRSDHLLPTSGRPDLDSPECWVTLGAIAARTQRVNFGPMVSPIGFRNPALLAKMACTLHSYSKGRLVLSIGAGWYQKEYEAHGMNFPSLKERKEQFYEAIQIIRPLTEGKPVAFKGKYFSADTYPPKLLGKMHLVVGGRNSQIIRWAGSYADELNLFSPTLESLEKAKKTLEDTSNGRKVSVSQMGPFFIGDTQHDLEERVNRFSKRMGSDQANVREQISKLRERGILCGLSRDFLGQVEEKRKAGIERFYFQLLDPSDHEAVELLTKTIRG